MILRYILSVIVAIVADILAFILAPIAAIFYTNKDGREHLWKVFRWISTHDAPVDAGHVDGYWDTPTTKIGHWWSRVRWIWRNPAYVVSHKLGYDQRGMEIVPVRDYMHLRNLGIFNSSYFNATNAKGQKAFMYFAQFYYTKNLCVELYLGWKLMRKDPDEKCMLAFRVKPWKKTK